MREARKDEVTIIQIDTDNVNDINKFRKLWEKTRAKVLFVPKNNVKFIGKKSK